MNEDKINDIIELLGAIYIQTARMYDMLSIIADKLGADAVGLTKMHEEGKVLSPEPSIVVEEEINE